MNNHFDQLFTSISTAVVPVAWPELVNWGLDNDFNLYDWEDMYRAGELMFPVGVVIANDWPEWMDSPGAMIAYKGKVSFWYVLFRGAVTSPARPVEKIAERLNSMESTIYGLGQQPGCQFFPNFSQNWNPDNGLNMKFREQKIQLLAGVISCDVVVAGSNVKLT